MRRSNATKQCNSTQTRRWVCTQHVDHHFRTDIQGLDSKSVYPCGDGDLARLTFARLKYPRRSTMLISELKPLLRDF
jgi:hypothetical protein